MTQSAPLLPGRTCGACAACCTSLEIDQPEFRKPPGFVCPHLVPGHGCGIYETRYHICRVWHCVWRHFDFLPDGWRPDQIGVLAIDHAHDGADPAGANRTGIMLVALRPVETLFSPLFFRGLERLLTTKLPVSFALMGPPGYRVRYVMLNDLLAESYASGDHGAMADVIRRLAAHLEGSEFLPA